MKKLFFLFAMVVSCLTAMAGNDVTLLTRNGEELEIKLDRITSDQVVFVNKKAKKQGSLSVPRTGVYMIKTDGKKTVFFNEKGDQTTKKSVKVKDKNDVVYLQEGAELIVYDLNMSGDNISFKLKNSKKAPVQTYTRSEVFMIRHADGYKDIFSTTAAAPAAAPAAPAVAAAQPQAQDSGVSTATTVVGAAAGSMVSTVAKEAKTSSSASSDEDEDIGIGGLSYFGYKSAVYGIASRYITPNGLGLAFNLLDNFDGDGWISAGLQPNFAIELYNEGDLKLYGLIEAGPTYRAYTGYDKKKGEKKDMYSVDLLANAGVTVVYGHIGLTLGYSLTAFKFKFDEFSKADGFFVSLGYAF